MKPTTLIRPDKLLVKGIKTLSSMTLDLYADEKAEAKAKATLTFIGKKKIDKVRSQLYQYNPDACLKNEKSKDFEFISSPAEDAIYWLNFHGVHNVKVIQTIGGAAGLDRLTIRHILDTTQRPKVEEYDHYLFCSVKSILNKAEGELNVEQLSFILGPHYVISFQEEIGDHFEGIRNKLSEGVGLLRKRKSDYLLSQLLDAILDNYFETIDKMNLEITALEKELFKNPGKDTLVSLEAYKRSAQVIKKALGPFKEALLNILNQRSGLIKRENLRYFKDLANSATAALEEIESTLKMLEGLTNIHFATLSQKMNETMKMLTMVATIFIPLTFIAGVYGMNFENMPELRHRFGYFITLGVMGVIAVGSMIYMRHKKWM